MTRNITFSACIAALALSACSPVSNGQAGAVPFSYSTPDATAFVAGENQAQVTVRNAGNQNSIKATCQIKSEKFETEPFLAPTKVTLPAYIQGSAVPVTMTCTYGDESKTEPYAPKNLSSSARAGSAIGVALLCPICGLGVAAANAGRDKSNDIFGFDKLEMSFDL